MKYKVGDKVKIKTWEAMEKEFGIYVGTINCDYGFTSYMEKSLPDNRIVTIEDVINNFYQIKGHHQYYTGDMIEGYAEPQFKRGDKVLAWDYFEEHADEVIFLAYIQGATHPYIVVCDWDNVSFLSGKKFYIEMCKHAKPILQKKTVTLDLTDGQLEKIKELIKE